MNKFPGIGGIISGIPGLGGILGSFGVTGMDGAGFSPLSLFGDVAERMGSVSYTHLTLPTNREV